MNMDQSHQYQLIYTLKIKQNLPINPLQLFPTCIQNQHIFNNIASQITLYLIYKHYMLLLHLVYYQCKLFYIIITRIIGFIVFEFVYKYGYQLYIRLLLQHLLKYITVYYICNQNQLFQNLLQYHLKLLYIIINHIEFGLEVSTAGWAGLGISLTGGMAPSDVIIGWVDDNNDADLINAHTIGKQTPLQFQIKVVLN